MCATSIFMQLRITESQNGWGWKWSLEFTLSNADLPHSSRVTYGGGGGPREGHILMTFSYLQENSVEHL